MHINVQGYLDAINAPWGQLFYQLLKGYLRFFIKIFVRFSALPRLIGERR